MAQFARPSSDITLNTWTDAASGVTNIFTSIDEVTASDADYIINGLNAVDYYEAGLGTLQTPQAGNHIVRWRAQRSKTNKSLTMVMRLMQGTTQIASQTVSDAQFNAWTTFTYTLTAGEVSSITDYNDLRLRFDVTVNGGGGIQGQVSWAEFEVPDGQSFPPISASLAETLDAITLTSTVTVADAIIQASLAKTLDDVTLSSEAQALIAGSLSKALADVLLSSTAEADIQASLAKSLDSILLSSDAKVSIEAALQTALDDVNLSSAVAVLDPTNRASLAVTLDDITLLSDAEAGVAAGLSKTLEDVVVSSAVSVRVDGSLVGTLDDVILESQAFVGDAPITASLAATLDAVGLSAEAGVQIAAQLNKILDAVELSSAVSTAATGPIEATLQATLDDITIDSHAAVKITGEVIATINDVQLTSTAMIDFTAIAEVWRGTVVLDKKVSASVKTDRRVLLNVCIDLEDL